MMLGNSSHATTANAAYHHISTIEGLTQRALFLFKLNLFTKVLSKETKH